MCGLEPLVYTPAQVLRSLGKQMAEEICVLYSRSRAALHRWDNSLLRSPVVRARVVLHMGLASCSQSGPDSYILVPPAGG